MTSRNLFTPRPLNKARSENGSLNFNLNVNLKQGLNESQIIKKIDKNKNNFF